MELESGEIERICTDVNRDDIVWDSEGMVSIFTDGDKLEGVLPWMGSAEYALIEIEVD